MKKKERNKTDMTKTQLTISLDEDAWEQALENISQISNQVVATVFDYVSQNENIDFLQLGKNININLCLSNDSEIHTLNQEFRNIDSPTNVLSFANIDDQEFDTFIHNEAEIDLGDIIIALETMQREA